MTKGQFSSGAIVRRVIFLGGNCPGDSYTGGNHPGGINPGGNYQGAIFLGGNCPRTLQNTFW